MDAWYHIDDDKVRINLFWIIVNGFIFSLQPEPFTLTVAQSASVTYDGTVFTAIPFVQTNYCKMDIVDYPFDTQECIIKISSWSNSKEQLYLEHTNFGGQDSSAPINVRNVDRKITFGAIS